MIFYRTFEHGPRRGLGRARDTERGCTPSGCRRVLAIAVPLNTIFGIGVRSLLARCRFRGQALLNAADRPAVRDLAGRHRPRGLPLYGRTGWFGACCSTTASACCSRGRRSRSRRSSSPCRSSYASGPGPRELAPIRNRRRRRSARSRCRGSGGSRCRRSAGRGVYGVVLTTARALGEFGAVDVVSGKLSARPRPAVVCRQHASSTSTRPGPTRPARARMSCRLISSWG